MTTDRRYQVFVSSTYEDLRLERQEAMQALLELECIPAGMELFPATDDDQWTLIKRVIDECDYYIVIVAGRYGSLGPTGISYTEQEYRYAVETGKPVIAFLHKDPITLPVTRYETSPEAQKKLKEFRELVQKKVCKFWETPAEVGSAVSRSLVRLISTHPMPGWIRADKAADAVAATEMLRLRKTIEDLESRLAEAEHRAPKGSNELAQGEESYPIDFKFEATSPDGQHWIFERTIDLTWDEIFEELGPLMLDEATDDKLRAGIVQLVKDSSTEMLEEDVHLKGHRNLQSFSVLARDEQTVKIQLRALGLIQQSTKNRSVKDTRTFWSLTPYGDTVLVNLRAIRKGTFAQHKEEEPTGKG